MAEENHTSVKRFILIGLTNHPELQLPLFITFLLVYFITLLGNLGIIIIIKTDPQLHTPMYFFLSNLSFLDACYSSTITPNMLANFIAERKDISYSGCITQYGFFAVFATTEMFLLAAMAYDRYMAISNPLLYTVTMTKKVCVMLVVGSYLWGFVNSLIHTCSLLRLSFCGSNIINHFFCDLTPLLNLSCSNIYMNVMLVFIFGTFFEISTFLIIIVSYILIITAVLRIHSKEGRHKAFSTCASHLTAVIIFHGTILFMYFHPSSSYSLDTDKMASVFYTVMIPMLNPLIYSLRNKDVKCAVKKVFGRKIFIQ
ncbi:LOW QUALITY PROTEIN: olfactory receptor 1052-like [Alligator sinensis]|uniref:Olfactory receptor n=1 Tax=Alligator sinensis TaxID=38654 RepID=A0A3Q0HDB4_ALLSI|nr:LOW QUALITY PROTEIN: olfactory receptor 1052-like [Alligator sinensis]